MYKNKFRLFFLLFSLLLINTTNAQKKFYSEAPVKFEDSVKKSNMISVRFKEQIFSDDIKNEKVKYTRIKDEYKELKEVFQLFEKYYGEFTLCKRIRQSTLDKLYPALKTKWSNSIKIYFEEFVPIEEINKILESLDIVEYTTEPIEVVFFDEPDDLYYQNGQQWNLSKVNAEKAWDITKGLSTVKIGIIEAEGVKTNHVDLQSKIDGTSTYNDEQHGTQVASIAGAATDNDEEGIASLAWNLLLHPEKTTLTFDYADAILSAANSCSGGVINCSFGVFTSYTESSECQTGSRACEYKIPYDNLDINDAISDAQNSIANGGYNCVIIAAYGNSASQRFYETTALNCEEECYPGVPYRPYPASYDGVIGVTATDNQDVFAGGYQYNYGRWVDVSAPGMAVKVASYTDVTHNDTYETVSGTSFASPLVAALAGLIRSTNSNLTPAQVQQIIEATSYPLGTSGKDYYYGSGRVDAYMALKYTIENYGGTFDQDVILPAGDSWAIQSGKTLKFASGKKLIVNGTLNATNATFTGTTTSSTWGGIVFQPGSSGNLNGCNINHVYANGAGAITINGSSPTIQYCTIENNNTGTTYGVSILNNANPYLHHNTISANSSHAVYISNANGKFQYDNIYGTTGNYCLYANDAAPIFSYSTPTPYYEGKNLLRNGQYGIYATSGSNVSAGFTQWAQNNSIHTNSSYNVVAQSNSIVSAVNNWWNTTVQSQITSKLNADGTSTIYYSPFRTSAPSAMMKSGEDYSDPGLVSEKLYEAIELRLSGRENESLEILKEIIEKAPETKEAILALNEIGRLQSSDEISSVEDFIREVTLSTKSTDKIKTTSELLLAKILSKQGKIKSAIEINNRVILKEKGTEYELTAGLRNFFIYYNSGDIKNAERELKNLKSGYKDNENLIAVEWMLGVENNFSQNQDKEDLPESKQEEEMLSEKIQLLGNYPNPFNPTTEIKFSVPVTSNVKLTIYNIMGQEIKSFESDGVSVGTHSFNWNGRNKNEEQVSSGIYIYRLRAIGNNGQVFDKSAKMMMLK